MKLCVDCIHVGVCYRQGAVDPNYADKCGDYEVIRKGHWIPISERLPEENKQVLIQYRTRYRDDVNLFDVTSRADYNYWQGVGREIDVIAWMPLPEPYKDMRGDTE